MARKRGSLGDGLNALFFIIILIAVVGLMSAALAKWLGVAIVVAFLVLMTIRDR